MKALRAFALFSFLFCQLWWPYSAYAAPYSGTGLAKGSVMGISGSRFQPGGTTTSGFTVGSTSIAGYAMSGSSVLINRETAFNFAKGAASVAGTILDGLLVSPTALNPGLVSKLKGGLIGLAGGYLASKLIEKGWQWMDAATCEMSVACYRKQMAPSAPYSATNDFRLCMSISPYTCSVVIPNANFDFPALCYTGTCPADILSTMQSACKSMGLTYSKGYDWNGCINTYNNSRAKFGFYSSATPNALRPSSPVTDAEIQAFADAILGSNPKEVVQDYVDHNLPVPYVDSGTTRLKEPKVAPPPYVDPTTIHNPDGSTTVINTGTETEVLVSPDGGVTTRDNVTKTTTTTNPDGTTSTTTETSQTANPPQVETKDTAKELAPLFDGVVDAINSGVAAISSAMSAAVKPLADSIKAIGDFINPPDIPTPDTSTKKTPNESVPVALDTSDKFMGGTAGCPPPLEVHFTLGSQTGVIPLTYEPLCLFASYMRPFFILSAYMAAAFIIFRS